MTDGFLLVDKPEGPTSHDVVASARRALKTRRVGHAGTLDPFASGLLPLLIGRGTRLMPFLVGLPKGYEGVLRLGTRTETDDRTGAVVATSEAWKEVTDHQVGEAMRTLTGRLRQVPPVYSAKKINGRPAHRRARRGEEVELSPADVEVRRFALLGRDGPDMRFVAEVGTGTYLRALARDLGEALGCGAHLRTLRRTRLGPWRIDEALPFERVEAGTVEPKPLAAAVPHLARRGLNDEEAGAVRHGRPIPAQWEGIAPVALFVERRLIAVASRAGATLHPRVVLDP